MADKIETLPWRGEDYLETEEDIAAYLDAAFEDGDPMLIAYALDIVVRTNTT
jgi:DNA-binding phage protein